MKNLDKGWLAKQGEDVLFDYKSEFLRFLDQIPIESRKFGLPCDFDISKIKKIIKTSSSPKEAVDTFKKELNMGGSMYVPALGMLKLSDAITQDILLLNTVLIHCSSKISKKISEAVNKYIKFPSKAVLFNMNIKAGNLYTSEGNRIGEKFMPYI